LQPFNVDAASLTVYPKPYFSSDFERLERLPLIIDCVHPLLAMLLAMLYHFCLGIPSFLGLSIQLVY
jgi:hypothetical protein